ncbi:hypothetical protein D3C73_1282750 [compost metagenome]
MSTAVSAFTLLVRASVADNSLHFNQGWFAAVRLCVSNSLAQCRKIVAVFYAQNLPAVCFKTLRNILRECQVQLTVERDII